jgi:hypothetical protein
MTHELTENPPPASGRYRPVELDIQNGASVRGNCAAQVNVLLSLGNGRAFPGGKAEELN